MARATAVPVSGPKLDNRRVLAALIDLVIVGAGWGVILAAAGVLGESTSEIGLPLTAVGIGWGLYYYFACESGSGQTLGKRVMKIRVLGVDGAPADMREIGLRTVLRIVDGMFFYLVGLIVMLATGERRGRLGDLVGKTMIASADQPAPVPAPAPAPAVSRVPIAESGPAFEPTPEVAPEVEVEKVAEEAEVAEVAEPDVASASLKELASDVTAVTESEEREPEDEPVAEEEPAVELEDEPVELEDEPVAEEESADEADEEPVADEPEEDEQPEGEPVVEVLDDAAAEPEQSADEDVDVKVTSVETISAIDLVMEDSRQDS